MIKVIVRVISFGLFVAAVFAILISVVILAGLGAGYALSYVIPAINLGSAAIAGVLAFGIVSYCTVQFMRLTARIRLEAQDEDDEDEDEDIDPEPISDEQVETIADLVSEAVIMKIGSWGNRRSAGRHRR
jgi:hypothetical protein